MITVNTVKQHDLKIDNQAIGEFDAAIKLPPQSQSNEYLKGYFGYTQKTGNTPF
ncbi:MAG: hypothetical protein ACYT04_38090 [Nostoc sp.]